MARYDTAASPEAKYTYDPHIDPSLQWAGKAEGTSFEVPTSSIHIHEVIKPHKIIRAVQTLGDDYVDPQGSLFESDVERAKRCNDAIEFYQHKDKWTNRLIAGDSLVIMNSMLEKEGMAGQVQMVYIDPPYGIKYGSSFQPFVNKRDGMNVLAQHKRFYPEGNNLSYIQYINDFPYKKLTNLWTDTSGANDKIYVVQTSIKPIQHCLLMTTDLGDLVLDITCGSGTTA
jgi:hypothetical protein